MTHEFKLGFIAENERYFRFLQEDPSLNVFFFDPSQDAEGGGDEEPELQAVMQGRFAVPRADEVKATGTVWGIYAQDRLKPRNNITITLTTRLSTF